MTRLFYSLIIVAMSIGATMVPAQASDFIDADQATKDAGIRGYEIEVLDEASADFVFVQVVGESTRASSMALRELTDGYQVAIRMARTGATLEVATNTATHSGTVKRNGQTLAFWMVDNGQVITSGLSSIETDAAWVTLGLVVNDTHFVPGAMAFGGVVGNPVGNCATNCRVEHPVPDDCEGAFNELACCDVEADYDHCRRVCQCWIDHGDDFYPQPLVACIGLANAALIFEGLKCATQFLF